MISASSRVFVRTTIGLTRAGAATLLLEDQTALVTRSTVASILITAISGESVVDLEAAYTWNSNYTFVVGANNAFDQDAAINQNNLDGTIGDGSLYAGSTPWGTEGAFYYARVRVDF